MKSANIVSVFKYWPIKIPALRGQTDEFVELIYSIKEFNPVIRITMFLISLVYGKYELSR